MFYQDTLHAPEWVVKQVKEDYIFPIEEEVPPTVKLESNKFSDGDQEFVLAELLRPESLGCIRTSRNSTAGAGLCNPLHTSRTTRRLQASR